MSLGKLQAALATATNEFTLAAANINFDFSIVRNEAPKEYHQLGNALSTQKKKDAEAGSAHITARRLGALFDGICPPTPKLIRCYGLRVSEIAATTMGGEKEEAGIFADHAGVDGTSIWASATSSNSALQVLLLACMIARIWNAGQATSIWVELVEERRLEIARIYENGDEVKFALMAAATQAKITRKELAEWDASARAWLRLADRVKAPQQHKLRRLIDNTDVPVNEDPDVLISVIKAWKSALSCMEDLLGGMPQAVNYAPVLLAMSAWHIYPNILTVRDKAQDVCFDEPLVPASGTMTIGLSQTNNRKTIDTENRGIYWSLSLKHLRYYGNTIRTEAHLNQDADRISFDQFSQIFLGVVAAHWGFPMLAISDVATFVTTTYSAFQKLASDPNAQMEDRNEALTFMRQGEHWWHHLYRAALAFSDNDSEETTKLVRFGHRRSAKFLPHLFTTSPISGSNPNIRGRLFGVCDAGTIVGLFRDHEARIAYLRSLAPKGSSQEPGNGLPPYLIKYHHQSRDGLATLLPISTLQRKRKSPDHGSSSARHKRFSIGNAGLVAEIPGEDQEYRSPKSIDFTGYPESFKVNDVHYILVLGNPQKAALYQAWDSPSISLREPNLEDFYSLLTSEEINPVEMLRQSSGVQILKPLEMALRSFSVIAMVYSVIPNATIAVEVLSRPLLKAAWVQGLSLDDTTDESQGPLLNGIPEFVDRETAFACITFLLGLENISPNYFSDVFAMAYEDSLFIANEVSFIHR